MDLSCILPFQDSILSSSSSTQLSQDQKCLRECGWGVGEGRMAGKGNQIGPYLFLWSVSVHGRMNKEHFRPGLQICLDLLLWAPGTEFESQSAPLPIQLPHPQTGRQELSAPNGVCSPLAGISIRLTTNPYGLKPLHQGNVWSWDGEDVGAVNRSGLELSYTNLICERAFLSVPDTPLCFHRTRF